MRSFYILFFLYFLAKADICAQHHVLDSIEAKFKDLDFFSYTQHTNLKYYEESVIVQLEGKIMVKKSKIPTQPYHDFVVLDSLNSLIFGIENGQKFYILNTDNSLVIEKFGTDVKKALRGNSRSTFLSDYHHFGENGVIEKIRNYSYKNVNGLHEFSLKDTSDFMGSISYDEVIYAFDKDYNLIHMYDASNINGEWMYNEYFFTPPKSIKNKRLYEQFELKNLKKKYKIHKPEINKKPKVEPIIVGQNFTSFVAKDVKGNTFSMDSASSRFILLDFWYKSCMPCIKAIPIIESIQQKYKQQDLLVLGVNSHDIIETSMLDFINRKGIKYRVLGDLDRSIANQFKIRSYPTFVLLDMSSRKIVHVVIGYYDDLEQKLVQKLDELLKN